MESTIRYDTSKAVSLMTVHRPHENLLAFCCARDEAKSRLRQVLVLEASNFKN